MSRSLTVVITVLGAVWGADPASAMFTLEGYQAVDEGAGSICDVSILVRFPPHTLLTRVTPTTNPLVVAMVGREAAGRVQPAGQTGAVLAPGS